MIHTIDAKKGEIVLQPLDISIQQFNEKRKYDTFRVFRVFECAMEMIFDLYVDDDDDDDDKEEDEMNK